MIPDDRLRLIFTCCHPALAREAQVALTLRLVCGLTTAEIAQAFLVLRADHGGPGHPGQEEDLRRPDRLPGAGRGRAAGPAGRRAHRGAPAVHHRPHRARRRRLVRADLVDRAVGLARMLRAADAGRARGPRAARADPADRRPAGHPARAGRAGCCCSRNRTGRSGTGPPSTRAPRWSARRCAAAAPGGSRCRPPSPPCTPRRPAALRELGVQPVQRRSRAGGDQAVAGDRLDPAEPVADQLHVLRPADAGERMAAADRPHPPPGRDRGGEDGGHLVGGGRVHRLHGGPLVTGPVPPSGRCSARPGTPGHATSLSPPCPCRPVSLPSRVPAVPCPCRPRVAACRWTLPRSTAGSVDRPAAAAQAAP